MKILKPYFPFLPCDYRTHLKTPTQCCPVKAIDGDEYCHIGLTKGLSHVVNSSFIQFDHLELQINVDGIPLFRSSTTSMWPIPCLVRNVDALEPFVVGIFCEKEKPGNAAELLSEFVSDPTELLGSGFCVEDKNYPVLIHSFVCDAPARAFLKGIKSH